MKVKLIDPTGISLADGAKDADGNLLPFDVTFTREGPHGTLYRINNEWYAARRFKVVEDASSDEDDLRVRYWQLVDKYGKSQDRMWTAEKRVRELEREIEKLETRAESYIEMGAALERRCDNLKSEIERLKNDKSNLLATCKGFEKTNDLLLDQRDKLIQEVEGLKSDVKAAEDAYDRLEEEHSHCPKSILAAELFELFNRDLVNADVHVFRSQEPEPITDVSFGDAEGTIAIAFADRTTEHFKQREPVWVQLKDRPTPSRLETVKEWLITYTEDSYPKTDGMMTYVEARTWLLCNASVPNFQPVYVYKQGERGHMTMMDSHSFFDNEEYYTR